MIRYIHCIRKKQDISLEEFRTYWNSSEYNELLKRVIQHYQPVKHSKSLTLKVELGETLINQNDLEEPFDATIELFWESANQLTALYEKEEAQTLARQLRNFENDFADIARSTAFFTMEQDDA